MKKKLVREKFREAEKYDLEGSIKHINKFLSTLEKEAQEKGYKYIEIDLNSNRFQNIMDIIGVREETDDEFNQRVVAKAKKDLKAIEHREAKRLKKEKQERKMLEQLQEKYGNK